MEKILKLLFVVFLIILLIGLFYPRSKQNHPGETKTATKPAAGKINSPTDISVPKLSIEKVFSANGDKTSKLDQSKIVKLIATGDVIPARGANWPAVTSGNFHYNWEKTADFLKTGDITLINLETPLMKGCQLQTSGFSFCGKDRQVEGLAFAGVDMVNISNNHIGNFGQAGIEETTQLLEKNNIRWCGFSNLGIIEIKGTKFGFLGFNAVGVKVDRDSLKTETANAKSKVDVLIVSIHWGKEYELIPTKDGNIAPDNPLELSHLIIDAGTDLIIGNHPHWVQGVEIYKDKFISYAHGNFIFDQTWSQETQEGAVGSYIFYAGKLQDVSYKPIVVGKSYQPEFAPDEVSKSILKRMQDSTTEVTKLQHS